MQLFEGQIFSLIILLFVFFVGTSEVKLKCKDDNNEDVDWFVAYKLPKDKKSGNVILKNGTGFLYISSKSVSNGWSFSKKSVNSSISAIGSTLEPIYSNQNKTNILWILYNDETPNKTVTFELGHTKGIILATREGGIWLVHSVPRFPPLPDENYSYPRSGVKFGQSFLCLSLLPEELENVGKQLTYNEPQIYSSNIPLQMRNLYPNLVNVVGKRWVSSAPWNHEQELQTSGQVKFQSFAKSSKFNKDLYADWVASTLKVDLAVETWPNGQGRLPSECAYPFKVYNIQGITVQQYGVSFSDHVDHSKWGVSLNTSLPWVCVGDINRMESQKKRGGGTVCIQDKSLWSAYKTLIATMESCSSFGNKIGS